MWEDQKLGLITQWTFPYCLLKLNAVSLTKGNLSYNPFIIGIRVN